MTDAANQTPDTATETVDADKTAAVAAAAAAPDAATAAAAKVAAADAAAGKSPEEVEAAAATERTKTVAALGKVKPKHYRTVHGGVLIDPETQKVFNGENAVKSHMTPWLDFQIKNNKIAEDE